MKRFIKYTIFFSLFFSVTNLGAQSGYFRPEFIGWPTDSTQFLSLMWNPTLERAAWVAVAPGDTTSNVYAQGDSICVIDPEGPDTTCVSQDSVIIIPPDSICVIQMGDTTCFYQNNGMVTFYTGDGFFAGTGTRDVDMQGNPLRFHNFGFTRFTLHPNPSSPGQLLALRLNTTVDNIAGLEIENSNANLSADSYIRYTAIGTSNFSHGIDKSLNAFSLSESADVDTDPFFISYATGDSTVFKKPLKVWMTLLDRQGDAGGAGNILSSTGTGIDWVTAASLQDGNGLFTAANSNVAVIPTTFIAKVTNTVQWLANSTSIRHTLTAATNNSASWRFNNATMGTTVTDGLGIACGGNGNASVWLGEDESFSIGKSIAGGQKIDMVGTQGGLVYEPSIYLSGGPVVMTEGVHNQGNVEITTQVFLQKNQYNINVTMGSTADTLFLPKIITSGSPTVESAAINESGVGQEYTISNFHATDNVTICAFNEVAGTDDSIDGGLCISLGPGESIIVKCVRLNNAGGNGIWFSYN
jgi:hypothetical protein